MKKNILALLLAGFATASFAQNANPFMPPKPAAPETSPSQAALAGMPTNAAGQPIGPDGRPVSPRPPGQGMPPVVPPVPGSGMPGAAPAPDQKPEVRVRYVGKVNGQNVYKAESRYHFDKKKRQPVQLVEDINSGPPAANPAANPATNSAPQR